jgi:hypothetical protein
MFLLCSGQFSIRCLLFELRCSSSDNAEALKEQVLSGQDAYSVA